MGNPITLSLEGYTKADIDAFLELRLNKWIKEEVEARLKDVVNDAINAMLEKITVEALQKRINDELDICLEEGWRRTNSWGSPCGEKVTLKERIGEMLEEKANRGSIASALLKNAVERNLKPEIDKKVRELKNELEKRFNDAIQDKMGTAFRGLLGL